MWPAPPPRPSEASPRLLCLVLFLRSPGCWGSWASVPGAPCTAEATASPTQTPISDLPRARTRLLAARHQRPLLSLTLNISATPTCAAGEPQPGPRTWLPGPGLSTVTHTRGHQVLTASAIPVHPPSRCSLSFSLVPACSAPTPSALPGDALPAPCRRFRLPLTPACPPLRPTRSQPAVVG